MIPDPDEGDMDPVRAACRDLLRAHGPMSLPDLATRLVEAGHDLARDLALLDDHLFPFEEPDWSPHEMADARLADTMHLLDGLVLTTRLTSEHVDAGQPTVSPDLDPLLQLLVHDGVPLADGSILSVHLDDDTWHLSGPDGWMPGAPGQALVVRLEGGQLHLDTMDPDEIPADPALVERLADTHDRVREHLAGVEIGDLVLELRARHPSALAAPRRPLGDLLTDAGLTTYGDWVVDPAELDEDGVPIDLFADDLDPATMLESLTDHLVDDHDMTTDQADDFVLLTLLTTGVRVSPPDDLDDRERQFVQMARLLAGNDPVPEEDEEALDLAGALGALEQIFADDVVARAVPSDLLADDVTAAGPFAVLARRVAQGARDRYARSNAWWLYAQALEFLEADGLETERALRQALEASRDHVVAAVDLAWHLDDRGQAGAALGLLVEHGLGDTEWTDTLRAWARPGPMSAGRNDPCPCGSGRKHKVCCARHNGWPLVERIDWVFEKLSRFGARAASASLVDTVIARAGMEVASDGLPDDMVVTSLCLFDGGLIDVFCDLRGPLLPADELELLRAWSEEYAAAYEVIEVDPGTSMQLLDLTTGDRHDVVERTASRQVQPGEVMLSWLVPYPDGTTRIALGGVQVPLKNRASLLALLDQDPSAEDLAAWYGGLFAPPRLHNTDGDPVTMCATVIEVPDADAAQDALSAVGTAAADVTGRPGAVLEAEGGAFHLLDTTGDRTVVGAIRPDGTQLRLEANSAARIEALQDLVLDRVAGASIIDDSRVPIEDLVGDDDDDDDLEPEDPNPFGALDDLDADERAEMVAALDDWMADAEDRWCDEPVPALGGVTPRQAADDPTRRADLEALLAEFPRVEATPGRPRGMDPDRLRALLGLSG